MKVSEAVHVGHSYCLTRLRRSQVYKEVSNWWYATIFVVCTALAIGLAYAAKSGLPAWALIIALFFAFFFTPIIGTVRIHLSSHYAGYSFDFRSAQCHSWIRPSYPKPHAGTVLCSLTYDLLLMALPPIDAWWCSCPWEACRKHVLHSVRREPSDTGSAFATGLENGVSVDCSGYSIRAESNLTGSIHQGSPSSHLHCPGRRYHYRRYLKFCHHEGTVDILSYAAFHLPV